MIKFKYNKWMLLALLGIFASCESDDDGNTMPDTQMIEVTAGDADFSNYVAVGNSLTAGLSDGALFIAGQQNSFPNILAAKFALAGGGEFKQPLMSDNTGGILLQGNQIVSNRLVFNGSGPAPLESVIGPVTPQTELMVNNPTGPFNNMGVPGAKSFHLLANGYGNVANLQAGLANPFFVRMASNPDASVLEDVVAQSPTFFTLWIGNNDVLGYATTGGDGSNPITDVNTFTGAYNAIVGALTANGAKGIVANIPDVTALPYFTTVPYNPLPLDAQTAAALNQGYQDYNNGLLFMESIGQITAEERERRTINFVEGQNAVVIEDETLTDLSGFGIPPYRHATADDLLVLPSASFIGTTVGGDPTKVNGASVPLADKWVLIPAEKEEIITATATFNGIIEAAANQAGLGLFDANARMNELAAGLLKFDEYNINASLVFGGVFSLDGIHPNARGYAFIANEFLKAIDATYGSNFEEAGVLAKAGDFPTNYSPTLP